MKTSRLPELSLRARFVLGLGAMLLPLLLLAAGAMFALQTAVHALHEVVEELSEEMHQSHRLQALLLRAAMPPNDYLVHGRAGERARFAALSERVDQAFAAIQVAPFALEQERQLVGAAQEAWHAARPRGVAILALPFPLPDPARAGADMERFDADIERAVDLFDQVHRLALKEMQEELEQAGIAEKRMRLLIAAIFILGLAASLTIGALLARSVLAPVHALGEGARRFGAGELAHRVTPAQKDELGELATAFNAMAGALEQSRAALVELATHDGLTGLYNHRMFHTLLGDELARAQRFDRPVSLLILDIDHFKRVNDTHGHLAGDAILKGLSDLLGRQARAIDRVCRYGGEEITVILPETNGDAALNIAERLRATVAGEAFDIGAGRGINVAVSIGLASWPAQAATAEALIAAADAALYAAKQGGRNRVVRYEPSMKAAGETPA